MNDSPDNTPAEISDQIAGLQRQVFTLLLALIVVSGTLVAYLYYQSRVMAKNVEAIKPQATQLIKVYDQNRTNILTFVNQLAAFGQTHPDFQPILKKYGINPQAVPKK